MPTFILNDETVLTSHGFFVRNAGAKLDRFKENPVMLDSHDDRCVIGKWNNLVISGSQLKADTEFDTEDPDAMKISGKVDRGYINGVSMGIIPLDAELIDVPGLGTQLVVTSWELIEASTTPIPSNKSALRLYASDGKTVLKSEEIKLSLDTIINKKTNLNMDKKEIKLSVDAAKVLSLGVDPESSELNAAIMELSGKLTLAVAAKEKAEKDLNDHAKKIANELVDLAVKEGRITADKKDSFINLAVSDYKQAKEVLEAMPAKVNLSEKLKAGEKAPAGREDWNYMRWLKEDGAGLKAMETSDPDGFAKLKAEYKKA
jgi:HK97 family phage prohead protease